MSDLDDLDSYGLRSPPRKWALLELSLVDRCSRKEMDILHLQKITRYFEYLRDTAELQYSNFKLGIVSYELEENLQTLEESGLVEKQDGKFVLTEEGQKFAGELGKEIDERDLRKLIFAKQQLNDLSADETMYFMYRLIPESQMNSTEFARLEKKRTTLVCSLFLKGRISSNMAAKWLEMSEKDFLESVRNRG
jgi:predicted HTH domain antitoxin